MSNTSARAAKNRAARDRAEEYAAGGGPARPAGRSAERGEYTRRMTGLAFLRSHGKISNEQGKAGDTWGRLSRMARQTDFAVIKSCLAGLEGSGGGDGAGPTFPGQFDYEASASARAARWALITAQDVALAGHAGMIAALELICGEELTPKEALPQATEREIADMISGLRIALDLLIAHWRKEPLQV